METTITELDDKKVLVPVNKDDKNETERADSFDHPAEYWLACIGFAVGYGNLWRFPFMCYKMGGAAFLIPYCVALFMIAMPMYMVETLYGQLVACKLHNRYSIISKPFWAISITQFFLNGLTTVYYIALMAWNYSYLFDSFKYPLPWKIFNDPSVANTDMWCSDKSFFQGELLTETDFEGCKIACIDEGDNCA